MNSISAKNIIKSMIDNYETIAIQNKIAEIQNF